LFDGLTTRERYQTVVVSLVQILFGC